MANDQTCKTRGAADMQRSEQVVYVVDDEKVIAETLAMILKRAGFLVTAFEDPRQALSCAACSPPDLLISDVMMPGMSGVELAIRFRRLNPRCRILLFSGKAATAELLEVARNQGYDFECLLKPVHPADLLAKLREPLGTDEENESRAQEICSPPVSPQASAARWLDS
jgi:DNA-binding response OmpR family regulator